MMQRMMEQLFRYYLDHPQEGGRAVAQTHPEESACTGRSCDYIAGMTDRYVIQEYNRVFGLKI